MHAFKNYASPYNGQIWNSFDPELPHKDTEFAIKNKLLDLLTELKVFNFVATLVLEFKKVRRDDKTKYNTFYSNSKTETNINEREIDGVFKSIYATIISKIQNSLVKCSGRVIDSDHNINI